MQPTPTPVGMAGEGLGDRTAVDVRVYLASHGENDIFGRLRSPLS